MSDYSPRLKCISVIGRKVHVHHLRNGKELKEIVYDNHYDFNFQVRILCEKRTTSNFHPFIFPNERELTWIELDRVEISMK